MLIEHEGLNLKPYTCPAGKLTIGIGRNIEDNGISKEEALFLFENDINKVTLELNKCFNFFQRLQATRKVALIDMCFNLGLTKFLGFKKMIAALEKLDYEIAANEMLDSRWAKQVGRRAVTLSQMIREGNEKNMYPSQ